MQKGLKKNLKNIVVRSSFIYFLTFLSCAMEKFSYYKVYIAPILNKTNWVQLDTELLEYLHSFFNKFTQIERSKQYADVHIFTTITTVQMTTPVSSRFDEPVFSEVSIGGKIQLVTKKATYNFEFYENVPYIRVQPETLDHGLQRLYEKVASRIYFYLAKIIKDDKKI